MINNLLKLLVCAVVSVASLSGCTIHNSGESLDEIDREMIRQQIESEMAEIPSFDSIANTRVVVSPAITISKGDNERDIIKLCVICIPFLFTLAVLWICLHYKRANLLAKYQIIDASLNKGIQLPDSFYNNSNNSGEFKRRKSLTSGMMWTAVGLSGVIFFMVVGADTPCAMCSLPILVGLVKIISAVLENRSIDSGNENPDAQ